MIAIGRDAQIDIRFDEPGRAKLLVDGVDFSNLVYRFEFAMEANNVGRLVLYCRARKVRVHGMADVLIGDEHTARAEIPPLRSIFDEPDSSSQT